jgi:hypothetical protein
MFQALGYSGPILLDVTLRSMLGVKWVHAWHGFPEAVGGSPLDEEVNFEMLRTTDDLREKPDGILIDILSQIFFSVNLPGYASIPQNLEVLARKGHEFNGWPMPQRLST